MLRLPYSWQHGIKALIGFSPLLKRLPGSAGVHRQKYWREHRRAFADVQILLDDDRNTEVVVGMAVAEKAWMIMPLELLCKATCQVDDWLARQPLHASVAC